MKVMNEVCLFHYFLCLQHMNLTFVLLIGKPGPRLVDLQSILDSKMLMSQAVNLNLSLMKWRLWSELKLDMLSKTRCLLIGAGTLGCAVARVLIGWGITNITFVDNGIVSFSNPVRQCLYEYEDCVRKVRYYSPIDTTAN